MQRKKISWVRLDLAPVEVEEVVEAEEVEGEDSLLEGEVVEDTEDDEEISYKTC